MAQKSIYVLVAIAGIGLASGAAWWLQNKPAAPTAEAAAAPAGGARAGGNAPGVEVTRVKAVRLQDDAQAVGTLRSRQSVTLKPEVAGRVQRIAFADGAQVRRGQLLVQLDDTLQAAELLQAQAQLSIAQANFNRNQELVAQNFVAQRVLDESRAALQVAQAQVTLAQARQQRMRIALGQVAVIQLRRRALAQAPGDGRIRLPGRQLDTELALVGGSGRSDTTTSDRD